MYYIFGLPRSLSQWARYIRFVSVSARSSNSLVSVSRQFLNPANTFDSSQLHKWSVCADRIKRICRLHGTHLISWLDCRWSSVRKQCCLRWGGNSLNPLGFLSTLLNSNSLRSAVSWSTGFCHLLTAPGTLEAVLQRLWFSGLSSSLISCSTRPTNAILCCSFFADFMRCIAVVIVDNKPNFTQGSENETNKQRGIL